MYIRLMKGQWKVIYYETDSGLCYIEDFINSKNETNRAKIFNWLEQLEIHGPTLPRPYADLLEDGIHELRIKLSGDQIRFLYFFCYHEYIVLTHAFRKNSERVSKSEILKAKMYRDDFIERNSENKLRGH
jgi:phage-related protein